MHCLNDGRHQSNRGGSIVEGVDQKFTVNVVNSEPRNSDPAKVYHSNGYESAEF
jgi:hypothetical protein